MFLAVTLASELSLSEMFPFQSSHSGDKMHKLKSSQKDRCREFITLTQTGEKTALYCLAQHDWKLDIALDNYFANPEVSHLCLLKRMFT